MRSSVKSSSLIVFAILTIFTVTSLAQSSTNEGRKRGARGGALLGLTMGVVAGDAGLAAAGAVVGGVAGGIAGDFQDYQEDQKNYRAETLADAIGSKEGGGEGEAPQAWSEIDAFVGSWNVSMWSLDADGNQIDATAKATSALNTTRSVTFTYSDFSADNIDLEITGTSTLNFAPDRGFELVNHFSTGEEGNRFVGNYDNADNKYIFFYAGTDTETFTGAKRTDYRLEMKMVGADVIVLETWAAVGGEDKRLQSYRLVRAS